MRALDEFARENGMVDAWPDLPGGAQPVPDFPTDALPDDLDLLVKSMAAAHQAPEGMAAAFALGIASAAIVGRVEVRPKRSNPGY